MTTYFEAANVVQSPRRRPDKKATGVLSPPFLDPNLQPIDRLSEEVKDLEKSSLSVSDRDSFLSNQEIPTGPDSLSSSLTPTENPPLENVEQLRWVRPGQGPGGRVSPSTLVLFTTHGPILYMSFSSSLPNLVPGLHRKEDFDRAKLLINDAAKSGSYLYPIKVCNGLRTITSFHTIRTAVVPVYRVVVQRSDRAPGHRLLCDAQVLVEASALQTRPHSRPLGGRGYLHVRLRVSTPARCAGVCERPAGCGHHRPAHSQRERHHHLGYFEELSATGCLAGHL